MIRLGKGLLLKALNIWWRHGRSISWLTQSRILREFGDMM